jgi:UDP-glucuronate 4-epimerase
MALFKFTKAILEGQPINVYDNGHMRRDFTYITDIVAGIVSALDKNYPYEIFNLGNSKPVELMDFISNIEKQLGKTAEKNFLPLQPGDVPETVADINYSTLKLGFQPNVNVEEGIQKFISWYTTYFSSRKH